MTMHGTSGASAVPALPDAPASERLREREREKLGAGKSRHRLS